MYCTLEIPIRPITQEIADIDQDGRRGIGFRSGRKDGDGSPSCGIGVILPAAVRACGRRDDFETGLTGSLEEEGYGAIIGVCARADVD